MIMEMTCKVETITPEMAKRYLEHNSSFNRGVSPNKVNIYAKDMRDGAWQLNGEGIMFNDRGILINGQHRLSAIVKADVPVKMLVIRGVSNMVDLFDRGNARSTYQSLVMSGMSKDLANNINCAVAKLYLKIMGVTKTLSDNSIREFLIDHENYVLKAYRIGLRHSSSVDSVRTNHACMITAILIALEAGERYGDIEEFVDVLSSGFYDRKDQRAAIVCRNDILRKNIMMHAEAEREKAVMQFEKAIYDYCHKIERTKSYKNVEQFTYKKGRNK